MPKPRSDLVDRLQYLALRLVSMALHCFPVDANLRTARLIGDVLYRADRRHRERALANLRRSFPDRPADWHAAVARQSFHSMMQLFVELLFTTRMIRLDTWTRYVRLVGFADTLRLLVRRDRGLILLTAHYGNFEVCGYLLATLGFPTASVARPLDNRYISEWVFGVRERLGQRVIVKRGATAEVTAELDAGGTVAFVADQNAGTKGIFVDFFGRKASTYKSIGLLAMQYEAPVVVGYARRTGDRFHFEVGVTDVIRPQDWADHPDPLRYITQRYTSAIEAFIRDDPGQYWWVHRRWKTRPKGEPPAAYD